MDPTIPIEGPPGDTEIGGSPPAPPPTPSAPQRATLSSRLEQVSALLVGVVALEFLALLIGIWGDRPYRTFGDRLEFISLNLDAKLGLILFVAVMLATLRDVVALDFRAPRSDTGRAALIVAAVLGALLAVLALVGVGLDMSRSDVTAFGTISAAAVVHRLAIALMGGICAGWALAALGVRVTTRRD